MKKNIILGVSLVSLMICTAWGQSNDNMTTAKLKSGTPVATVQLGGNYFTQTQMPLGGNACLAFNANNYKLVNPRAILDFSEAQSFNDFQSALGIDVETHIGWGMFSASAAAHYAKSQQHSDYDLNINYIFDYAAKAVIDLDQSKTGTDLLSETGLQHYNNGPTDFSQNCGDSFISEADAGATLIVTYNLHFANQIDKNNFSAMLKADYGHIASISTKIQQAMQNTNSNVTVSLKAIQLGGNPERLQGVLGVPLTDGYAILNCGNGSGQTYSLNACAEAINNIINYAHAQGPYIETGLEKQISIVDGKPSDPAAFFYSDPTPTKWTQINVAPGFLYPTAEVIAAQSMMIDWYHADADDLAFLNHYIPFLQSYGSNQSTIVALQGMQTNLTRRVSEYNTLDVLTCFKPGFNTECLDKYNTMKTIRDTLYPINQKIIDRFDTAYFIESINIVSGLVNESYSIPFKIKDGGESFVYLDCNILDGVCQPSLNYYEVAFGENTLKFSTYVNNNIDTQGDLVWHVGEMLSYYEGKESEFMGKKAIEKQQWHPVPNPK